MPNLTLKVKPKSSQHEFIKNEVRQRVKMADRRWSDMRDQWTKNEDQVLAYLPEKEDDKLRRRRRENDGEPKYTTIMVPYTYAILMSSLTYWASVFLSRAPVFQFEGNNAVGENQTLAVEALISHQIGAGRALPVLYSWLYDAGRFGVGWIGVYWDEVMNNVTQIAQDPNDSSKGLQRTVQVPGFIGNRIYNLHPKDALSDPRVPMREFQSGEFFAVRRRLPWMTVRTREEQGYFTNVKEIDPNISPRFNEGDDYESSQRDPEDSEFMSGDEKRGKNHPDIVPCYEVYIKIIPKDWKLNGQTFPEIWVITITADWNVILGFQPLGHLHCEFPFRNIEVEPDAYALVNRGIPEIAEPLQNTMDWLVNSHFYNVRASLNNLFVVDPMKVFMKDLTDPLPGGAIRTKPGASGDIKNAVMQIPIQDVTQQNVNDLQVMFQMGERSLGVSDPVMGVQRQGGRRSATEARQTAGFSVNRLKTVAEYMSATSFDPLSRMLVMNSQQFYDREESLRRVGNLASYGTSKYIDVNPEMIRGQFDFVPVDGTLPVDRIAIAQMWQQMFGALNQMPGVAAQFDLSRIFSYVAQLMGLRNIDQFRFNVQVAPDQQLDLAARSGNAVPIRGGPGASSDPTTLEQSENPDVGAIAVG